MSDVSDSTSGTLPSRVDLAIRGRLVTCIPSEGNALGIIEDGLLAIHKGRIAYVGPARDVTADQTIEARGCVLPGLIDPHTHLVFDGDRSAELAARFAGIDYRTVASEGGGIMSTVRSTRAASRDVLVEKAIARATVMRSHGVTTIEAKSGYGLTTQDELRMLDCAKAVEAEGITRIEATFLGAHAVPAGRSPEDYLQDVIHEQLPAVVEQGAASACDVYCDEGAFSLSQARQVLEAARKHGLRRRAHMGQFVDLGGVQMAAELGATSVDHLEQLSDEGLAAMAKSGVVGVLLPGAWRTLRQTPPDAARFRAAGVTMAIGSDFNPGTSQTPDLLLCAALAVRDAGLTMEEAILGVTVHAAQAIGLQDKRGTLAVGAPADIAIFSATDPRALVYQLGGTAAEKVLIGGEVRVSDPISPAIW
ncbi:MAG: imidazolonepropionase [Polyangiales bacterium]